MQRERENGKKREGHANEVGSQEEEVIWHLKFSLL